MRDSELSAFLITPKHLSRVSIDARDRVSSINRAIGSERFDVVRCEDQIDIWVDDEGLINGSSFNMPLTILAHTLGCPVALFGNGVALRSDPATGETHGLTPEQEERIVRILSTNPSEELLRELAATLGPLWSAMMRQRNS